MEILRAELVNWVQGLKWGSDGAYLINVHLSSNEVKMVHIATSKLKELRVIKYRGAWMIVKNWLKTPEALEVLKRLIQEEEVKS